MIQWHGCGWASEQASERKKKREKTLTRLKIVKTHYTLPMTKLQQQWTEWVKWKESEREKERSRRLTDKNDMLYNHCHLHSGERKKKQFDFFECDAVAAWRNGGEIRQETPNEI